MYHYSATGVSHTTYRNKTKVLKFPDGQLEREYPDTGRKVVIFPTGTVRVVPNPKTGPLMNSAGHIVPGSGNIVSFFADGTVGVRMHDEEGVQYEDVYYANGTRSKHYGGSEK